MRIPCTSFLSRISSRGSKGLGYRVCHSCTSPGLRGWAPPRGPSLFSQASQSSAPSGFSLPSSSRTDRKGVQVQEGTLCAHLYQGLPDDAADVPPPLGDVWVVVIQVWRKGQAERAELLCGYNRKWVKEICQAVRTAGYAKLSERVLPIHTHEPDRTF